MLVVEAADLVAGLDVAQHLQAGTGGARRDELAVGLAVVVDVGGRSEPELRALLATRVHDAEVVAARLENGRLLLRRHGGYAADELDDALVAVPGARRHDFAAAALLARVARALAYGDARVGVQQVHELVEVVAEELVVLARPMREVSVEPLVVHDELAEAYVVVAVGAEALQDGAPLARALAHRPKAHVHLVRLKAQIRVDHDHRRQVVQLAQEARVHSSRRLDTVTHTDVLSAFVSVCTFLYVCTLVPLALSHLYLSLFFLRFFSLVSFDDDLDRSDSIRASATSARKRQR